MIAYTKPIINGNTAKGSSLCVHNKSQQSQHQHLQIHIQINNDNSIGENRQIQVAHQNEKSKIICRSHKNK